MLGAALSELVRHHNLRFGMTQAVMDQFTNETMIHIFLDLSSERQMAEIVSMLGPGKQFLIYFRLF